MIFDDTLLVADRDKQLVGAIGNRMDITWNIIPLVLWVKIENSTIPIAATATVMRLFLKVFVNKEKKAATYAYSSERYRGSGGQGVELGSHVRSGWGIDRSHSGRHDTDDAGDRSLNGSETELVDDSIHVKVEYEVRVMNRIIQDMSSDGRLDVAAGQ